MVTLVYENAWLVVKWSPRAIGYGLNAEVELEIFTPGENVKITPYRKYFSREFYSNNLYAITKVKISN
jgi:hypothetical protein